MSNFLLGEAGIICLFKECIIMAKEKLLRGRIPTSVMEYIANTLQGLSFGEVVLVAQDGVLVQLEWSERLRLDRWGEHLEQRQWETQTREKVMQHIAQEFSHLQYGRLVIVVKAGSVVQMERTEKQRFTGLDGEGI